MKAKQTETRRRKQEGKAPSRPGTGTGRTNELSWREVQVLLDEEIDRLPEINRSVFILCHLEGLSREEATQRLGWKETTVSNRLATARKRLDKQLIRRGVDLATVLTVLGLATSPALPVELMATTIKAALATAAGEKLTALVSASVAQLVKSATTMTMNKAKIATVLLLTALARGMYLA